MTTFDMDLLAFFLHEAKASLLRARDVNDLPGTVADQLDAALAATTRAQASLERRTTDARATA